VDHAPLGAQWHKRCYTEFRQFLHQERRTIPLGQRRGDFERGQALTLRRFDGVHRQLDDFPLDHVHQSGILPAISIKQVNPVARTDSANHGEVVSLWTIQHDRTKC
jgi:hypothetical protein